MTVLLSIGCDLPPCSDPSCRRRWHPKYPTAHVKYAGTVEDRHEALDRQVR